MTGKVLPHVAADDGYGSCTECGLPTRHPIHTKATSMTLLPPVGATA